jgi:hypothetical protein
MAAKKNNLSGLANRLGRGGTGGLDSIKLLQATNLVSDSNSGSERSETPRAPSDAKNDSMTSKVNVDSIKFGSPSSTKTTTSQTGSEWTNLLKQTASGGVASLLGGGVAGIPGLGSLIEGIAGLFGGSSKAAPPPLVRFQLPNSQDQTVYISSSGSTVYQSSATEPSARSTASAPIYGSNAVASNQGSAAQPLRYQSSEIAQAVKNAILNSSSLNDVIAEI